MSVGFFQALLGSVSTPVVAPSLYTLGNDIDPLNRFTDIYFDRGTYHAGGGAVVSADLQGSLSGGTATSLVITSVLNTSNGALAGGETTLRVYHTYTGNANGTEVIEIKPATGTSIEAIDGGVAPLLLNTSVNILSLTYDADYQAVLSYAVAQGYKFPVREYRLVENDWVIARKAINRWTTRDVIYRRSKYGDRNYALINWRTPGTFNETVVGVLAWTYGVGFTFGTTGYLESSWIPSVNGVNYTTNDASIFHTVETNVQSSTQFDYGVANTDANNSNRLGFNSRSTGDVKAVGINSGIGNTSAGTATSIGRFLNDRVSSATTGHDIYVDGVLFDGTNFVSSAMPNQSLITGARKLAAGTISDHTTRIQGMLCAGSSMGVDAAAINTIEVNFETANAAVSFLDLLTTDDLEQLTTDTPQDLTTD